MDSFRQVCKGQEDWSSDTLPCFIFSNPFSSSSLKRPTSKRFRHEADDCRSTKTKPRLPSCLIGTTPEVNSTALRDRRNTITPQAGVSGQGEAETDPHRLRQRQKQIDYGKNTLGYDRYKEIIPKEFRRRTDPRTPDIHARISTKRFNGLVRAWRRRLHDFDPHGTSFVPSMPSSSAASPSAVVSDVLIGGNSPERAPFGETQSPLSEQTSEQKGLAPTHASNGEEDDDINTQQGGPGSPGVKDNDKRSRAIRCSKDGSLATVEFTSGLREDAVEGEDMLQSIEETNWFHDERGANERYAGTYRDTGMLPGDPPFACYSDDDLL